MSRIEALAIPSHDPHWLDAPATTLADTPTRPAEGEDTHPQPQVLPRGGVIDLTDPETNTSSLAPRWTLTATWAQQAECEIDVVAFVLDEDEQVSFDEDFVFYGAPENPAGTVRLLSDGPTEQTVSIEVSTLPPSTHKVVVAAAIDGPLTFGDVGAVQLDASPGTGAASLTQATLDAATTERTMLLAEVYRRGPRWRLRMVGQGYDHGLDSLARSYGVDVTD